VGEGIVTRFSNDQRFLKDLKTFDVVRQTLIPGLISNLLPICRSWHPLTQKYKPLFNQHVSYGYSTTYFK